MQLKFQLASAWLALSLTSSIAFAQPSETDRSLAQSLFEQGKQLMDQRDYAQACPKLQESQRLDPGGGTLLNLALCHEQQGLVATAWTEFKEALSMARRDGRQDRIDAATEHIAALEPKLPFLTLAIATPAAGQEIRLDGVVVGSAAWGSPLSLDPGTHQLSASAPGKRAWSKTVVIVLAQKVTVTVPQLEADEAQSAAPAAAPAGSSSSAPDRVAPAPPAPSARARGGTSVVGWVLGGVGVAAIGVGSYFGVRTFSQREESDKLCPTDTTCRGNGAELNEQAYTSAWVSNIGIGAGILGVGVGTYLILSSGSSPQRDAKPLRTSPRVVADVAVLRGGGALGLSGRW